MAGENTRPVNNAVIVERLGALIGVVHEVKQMVSGVDTRTDTIEKTVIRLEAKQINDSDKLEDHERRIATLEKIMHPLVVYSRILSIIGSALMLSILALIWALITGQATVMFK